jgi:hypothetical protein
MRAFLLTLGLVAAAGCGLTSGEDNTGPRPIAPVLGPRCAALDTILRGCSLLTPGPFTDCEEPEDAEEECQFDCAARATCADLQTLLCVNDGDIDDLPFTPIGVCFAGCEPPPFDCGGGQTISNSAVCDFSTDCFNGADEVDCGFVCAGGAFEVDQFQVCNGAVDCPEGDDEADCGPDEGVFFCPGGFSIPSSFICDGLDDCGDNSDEQDCGSSNPSAEIVCD